MQDLAAPTMGHLICTSALVMLIFLMPLFYASVTNNIRAEMVRRELKEVADYVSNTFANLYFLVNSTECLNANLTKELMYLPLTIEDSLYVVEIDRDGENASKVTAYLKDEPSVAAEAWLLPGLKATAESSIESGGRIVVVGCRRSLDGVYVWIVRV